MERALDADGIAESDGLLVITSPHQNSFDMPFVVEVWDGPPPDDLQDWQEVFEAHLDVGDSGVRYESPTMEQSDVTIAPGSYGASISARGLVAHGWPGSTDSGDEWRIRLWPSHERIAPRRVKQWTGNADTSLEGVVGHSATPNPKRILDRADPTRRQLMARLDALALPSAEDYADLEVDRGSATLPPRTIFEVAPSQLRLVLEGPDIDSIDPHGHLRRVRASIAVFTRQLADDRARQLHDLDVLIEEALIFDAADRERAGLTPR